MNPVSVMVRTAPTCGREAGFVATGPVTVLDVASAALPRTTPRLSTIVAIPRASGLVEPGITLPVILPKLGRVAIPIRMPVVVPVPVKRHAVLRIHMNRMPGSPSSHASGCEQPQSHKPRQNPLGLNTRRPALRQQELVITDPSFDLHARNHG